MKKNSEKFRNYMAVDNDADSVFDPMTLPDGRVILRDTRSDYGASVVLEKLRLDAYGRQLDRESCYLRRISVPKGWVSEMTGLPCSTGADVAFVVAWHSKLNGPCIQPCDPLRATHMLVTVVSANQPGWFTVAGQNRMMARALGYWRMHHERVSRKYGKNHYILPIGYTYSKEVMPDGVKQVSRSREMRELGLDGVAYIDSEKAAKLRRTYQEIFDNEDQQICDEMQQIADAKAAEASALKVAQPYFERLEKVECFGPNYRVDIISIYLFRDVYKLSFCDPEFEQKLADYTERCEQQYAEHQDARRAWRESRDEWRAKFAPILDQIRAKKGEDEVRVDYNDDWLTWINDRYRVQVEVNVSGDRRHYYGYSEDGLRSMRLFAARL